MPLLIQTRRHSNVLQRAYGLQGYLALQLIDDVFPVVDLDNPLPELAALKAIRLCSGWRDQAAVAAQFSKVLLRNPAGSQFLAVLDRMRCSSNAGASVSLHGPEAVLTGGGEAGIAKSFLDTRLGQVLDRATFNPPTPVCNVTGVSEAAPDLNNSSTVFDRFGAGETRDYRHLVLMPGTQLLVQTLLVNQQLTVFMLWHERPLAPQEDVAG